MSVLHDITAEALSGAGFRPLHAGDDYEYTFTVTQDGLPVNLTGAKLWLTVKTDPAASDEDAKLQLTSASINEIEIVNATQGRFVVKFASGGSKPTGNLAGTWLYDLQVKLAGPSRIVTLARGAIEFLENITRAVS